MPLNRVPWVHTRLEECAPCSRDCAVTLGAHVLFPVLSEEEAGWGSQQAGWSWPGGDRCNRSRVPTGRWLLNYSEPLHEFNELMVAQRGWPGYCLLLPFGLGLVWPWCTQI